MERLEYERMAALEDTLWWYRGLHASLLERLARIPMPELPYVLDAGCGTGGFLSAVRGASSRIVPMGVEFDAIAARMAAAKSGAIMVNGSVNALPFGGNCFDAIVSADVLCQSGVDEALALRESHRCLKSGGSLLINLPAFAWLRSSHDRHVHSVRRYTVRSARSAVEGAGFRVADIGYWNSLLFPVMALHRLTVGRFRSASDVRAFPPWQDRLFHRTMSLERRLARNGFRLPFGGSVWVCAVKP